MAGLIKFFKDWMLIIGMVTGAGLYLIYGCIPSIHHFGSLLLRTVHVVQPALLFMMLFLSFCRIAPSDLRPHRWHVWLLLIQGISFIALTLLLVWAGRHSGALAGTVLSMKIPIEAAMVCIICPTATACAVVTGKLGGDIAQAVTYTVFVNIMVAVLVPAMVPLIYPGGMTFMQAFLQILAKVFPMLIMPCLAAWAVRFYLPRLHAWLAKKTNLAFYIWAVSLTLAILMSTRSIVHSNGSVSLIAWIAVASLVSCVFQFWAGRRIGTAYGESGKVTVAQSLGQKNTVFAIWMGYTFMDPIISVAGGFYSIWHNVYNSWQLYRRRKDGSVTSARPTCQGHA